MFPRLCLNILTTGSLGVQNEISAYAPIPLSSPDNSIIDMRIGEVFERLMRPNQHGLSYFVQSTGTTKVELVKNDPINGKTVLNTSIGKLHALFTKFTTEQRIETHVTYTLVVTNEAGEMIKIAVLKS